LQLLSILTILQQHTFWERIYII